MARQDNNVTGKGSGGVRRRRITSVQGTNDDEGGSFGRDEGKEAV
jgi:hypothetical protein